MQHLGRILLSFAIVLGTITIAPLTADAQQRRGRPVASTNVTASGRVRDDRSANRPQHSQASARNNQPQRSQASAERNNQPQRSQASSARNNHPQRSQASSARNNQPQRSHASSERNSQPQRSHASSERNSQPQRSHASSERDNRPERSQAASERSSQRVNDRPTQERSTQAGKTDRQREQSKTKASNQKQKEKEKAAKQKQKEREKAAKEKQKNKAKAEKEKEKNRAKAEKERQQNRAKAEKERNKANSAREKQQAASKNRQQVKKNDSAAEARAEKEATKEIEKAEKQEARDKARAEKREAEKQKRDELTSRNSKVDVVGEGTKYEQGVDKQPAAWVPTHIIGIGPRGGMSSFLPKTEQWPAWRPANIGFNGSVDLDYTFAMINSKGWGFGFRTGVSAGYTQNGQGVYLIEETPYTDAKGNDIDYTITAKSVKELNSQLNIEVPLQFNIRLHGFYADLGVRFQLPLIQKFTQTIEDVKVDAYYSQYDVHVVNSTATGLLAEADHNKSGKWDGSKFSILVAGEIGYYIPLSKHLLLGLGLYAGYSVYTIQSAQLNPTGKLFTITGVGETDKSAAITATTLNKAYTKDQGYFDLGAKLSLNVKF